MMLRWFVRIGAFLILAGLASGEADGLKSKECYNRLSSINPATPQCRCFNNDSYTGERLGDADSVMRNGSRLFDTDLQLPTTRIPSGLTSQPSP